MGVLDEKAAGVGISVITIPHPARAFKHSSRSHSSRRHSDVLSTIEDTEFTSSRSVSPATTLSPDGKSDLNPFSPFYNPSPTRLSLEAQRSESRRLEAAAAAVAAAGGRGGSPMAPINTTAFDDKDLEAGSTPPTSACSLDKSPMHSRAAAADDVNFHCTVWPSRRAMQLKKKAMRREKARYMLCGWMAGLSEPARVWAKVALAVLLVGAAVGVAIGVSKAVGGGVWRSNQTTNAPLGHGSTR